MTTKYTATQIDDNPVGPDGIGISGSPFKSYVAIANHALTEVTANVFEVGKKYLIKTYGAGDDFTNIGADVNGDNVRFTGSGTTAAVWTNGSTVFTDLDPEITPMNPLDNNFIGNIVWEYYNDGLLNGFCLNAFDVAKTAVSISNGDMYPSFAIAIAYVVDSSNVQIEIIKTDGSHADSLSKSVLKIEAY